MTETLVAEPAVGAVGLSPSAWNALLDLTGPGTPDADDDRSDGPDGLPTLEVEGLLWGGELLGPVARALESVRNPCCRLSVSSRGLVAQGWLDADVAALLIPRDAGLLELAWLPAAFLPDALARVVELEPRPVPEGPPLRLAPGTLAHLLAAPDDHTPLPGADPRGGPGPDNRARQVLASVKRHWRIDAHTMDEAGPGRARSLEVLDTPGGMWRLFVDGRSVELRPSSTTSLWRILTLVPSAAEEGSDGWMVSER